MRKKRREKKRKKRREKKKKNDFFSASDLYLHFSASKRFVWSLNALHTCKQKTELTSSRKKELSH